MRVFVDASVLEDFGNQIARFVTLVKRYSRPPDISSGTLANGSLGKHNRAAADIRFVVLKREIWFVQFIEPTHRAGLCFNAPLKLMRIEVPNGSEFAFLENFSA